MILEAVILDVKKGREQEFEEAFNTAQNIINKIPGYISHTLDRCIETPNQYLLQVKWNTLKDHTQGFRQSKEYQEWKKLLHHFYDPFPTVKHYENIL